MGRSDIYGTDPTDYASGIAAEALKPPSLESIRQANAVAKGNVPEEGDVEVISNKKDSRTDSKGN